MPIVRGPPQKQVWTFAKATRRRRSQQLHPKLITAEYRIAKRPAGRVLVDYNQNAWGRTLAVRLFGAAEAARDRSTPVTWEEVERGSRSKTSASTTCPRAFAKSAISGSRCSLNARPREPGALL